MEFLNGKRILITGGTGSLGEKLVREILTKTSIKKICIYSRDEMKQFLLFESLDKNKKLDFFIGDIRDRRRLIECMKNIDFVIHAAAMKIVPLAEKNPSEAIKTNIIGAINVIDAAQKQNVKRVIALSTDKATNPINLYGATKLCSDKLFISANTSNSVNDTKFSVVRYGNVINSRGSVIPLFQNQISLGEITLTDEKMTRFFITINQAVDFVLMGLSKMLGGEVFVPKIPSMNLLDLAKAIAPNCKIKVIGRRPGEKLHETMISNDDAHNTIEMQDYYVIKPEFDWFDGKNQYNGVKVEESFSYDSNSNTDYIDSLKILELMNE